MNIQLVQNQVVDSKIKAPKSKKDNYSNQLIVSIIKVIKVMAPEEALLLNHPPLQKHHNMPLNKNMLIKEIPTTIFN